MKQQLYLAPETDVFIISLETALLQGSLDLQQQSVSWNWNAEDVE